MKDKFGHERGACINCPDCQEFLSTEGETRCTQCGCVPVAHEKIVTKRNLQQEEEEESEMSLEEPPSHFPVIISLPQDKTLVQTNYCCYPHCLNDVHFDLNTGIEYSYCSQHNNGTDMQSADMIMIDLTDEDGQEMILPLLNSVTVSPEVMIVEDDNPDVLFQTVEIKCALAECYNSCYVDESGFVYECCGYAHAKEYQKRLLQLVQGQNIVLPDSSSSSNSSGNGATPLIPKCTLSDCNNPCHVDDNGKVHECCGFSHAMEHQRRLSLMKQDISQNVVKGVTHCLLPNCNNLTWPFQNYCGRSHADIGIKQGLTVPSAVGSNNSSNCIFPNCGKPKYTEQNGTVHPYCGKAHADLAKSLGIFPTAASTDDQCQLEGCTRPKVKEGPRVHDYCSMEHAKKDEPNRQVLTPLAKVKAFLKQYESTLKIISLEENDHAKPGGALFKKFKNKMMSLPKDQRQTCLAFHGTPATNIQSICQNGYNSALRSGQAHGPGEYFAISPGTSMGYCRGGKKMLLNELLLGQQGTHHTKHGGDVVVMKDPVHDLPRFVITFQ